MHYLMAFAICVALTGLEALAGSENVKWLIVCDMNVGIFLWLASAIEKRRGHRASLVFNNCRVTLRDEPTHYEEKP